MDQKGSKLKARLASKRIVSRGRYNEAKLKTPDPNDSRAEMVEGEVVERKVTLLFTVRLDDGRVLSQCFIGHKDAHRRKLREIVPEVGERVWVEVLPQMADTGRIHLFYQKSGQ